MRISKQEFVELGTEIRREIGSSYVLVTDEFLETLYDRMCEGEERIYSDELNTYIKQVNDLTRGTYTLSSKRIEGEL